MSIRSLFSKMFRRKFVHAYFKVVKLNQYFMHEGRKYQKLSDMYGITAVYPSGLKTFKANDIVIAIYY